MSTGKELKKAQKKLRLLVYDGKTPIEKFRRTADEAFASSVLPYGVEEKKADFQGVSAFIYTPTLLQHKRILLYVHGGSFVAGSAATHRAFAASLSHYALCSAVLVDFRLAPAYPFPRSLEDVQNAFRQIFMREMESGGSKIIIAADGSGASIATALILNLKDKFRAAIKLCALFSPILSISSKCEAAKMKTADTVFRKNDLKEIRNFYTYEDNFENPLVSPLNASEESLSHFPPLYIQTAKDELISEDASAFAARVRAAGGEALVKTWQGMCHSFMLTPEFLDEVTQSLKDFARVVKNGITEDVKKNEKQIFHAAPKLEKAL